MAMGTERSKALHNFTMPCELRWGNQRFLRCMKVNSNGQISPLHRFTTTNNNNNSYSNSDHHHHHRNNFIQQPRTTRDRERGREIASSSEFPHGSRKVGPTPPDGGRRFNDDDDGIAAMREKVMLDLQTAADKIKYAIFKDGLEEGEVSGSPSPPLPPPPPEAAAAAAEGDLSRPWNLRTRRAAFKTSVSSFVSSTNGDATVTVAATVVENESGVGKGLMVDVVKPNSQIKPGFAAVAEKSPWRTSGGSGAAASGEKKERAKFSVALSKRDIEEDFYSIVGHRPPRRPKKRAKMAQRQLDTLFPGLWLTEVTPDMYKVAEVAP